MIFTSHNILLSNGSKTLGDTQQLHSESNLWKSIKKSIELLLPQEKYDYGSMSVVDLGCLEGGYSIEFAKMGFNTLGIEARKENVAKCNYVKNELGLQNLAFVKDDVRNVKNYGSFDIVLNYGLLYHLDHPAIFLRNLIQANAKIQFLHTHYAPVHDWRYHLGVLNTRFIAPIQKRMSILKTSHNYRLSPLTKNEGYVGRWYKEWNKSASKENIEKSLWASINNYKSFWPTKTELVRLLHDVGYTHVFEQFNHTGDLLPENYIEFRNRSMFVAIK